MRACRNQLIEGADMDVEVLRDLRERDFWVTVQRDAYDVVSELLGIFCGHDDHPSRPAETSHVECHLLVQQAPTTLNTEDGTPKPNATSNSSPD